MVLRRSCHGLAHKAVQHPQVNLRHVQACGLLPKWVQWALTQQPALFNRAFRRLFAQVPPALVVCTCCHTIQPSGWRAWLHASMSV